MDVLTGHIRSVVKQETAATDANMRAFGASYVACYLWPEDTPEHRALRAAYCAGAAGSANGEPTQLDADARPAKGAITMSDKLVNAHYKMYQKIQALTIPSIHREDPDSLKTVNSHVSALAKIINTYLLEISQELERHGWVSPSEDET